MNSENSTTRPTTATQATRPTAATQATHTTVATQTVHPMAVRGVAWPRAIRRVAVLAAIGLPVVLTACGGSNNDTPTTPTTPPPLGSPVLVMPEARSFVQGVEITEFVFTNSGGAPNAADGSPPGCTVTNLPAGLSVSPTMDGMSCRITGAPTTAAPAATVTVTATNGSGSSMTTISITVMMPPPPGSPVLAMPEAKNFAQDVEISELVFTNSGGVPNAADGSPPGCIGANLPAGLIVSPTMDGMSCRITGTPTAMAPAATVTVIAANGFGTSSTTIRITVTDRLPNIATPVEGNPWLFSQNVAIADIVFVNEGGSPSADDATPAGCTVDKPLPAGLRVVRTVDGTSCRITGTPTAEAAPNNYAVTATNVSGPSLSSASAFITVPPLLRTSCRGGPVGRRSYRMTVTTTWSAANNGVVLPSGAGFMHIGGAVHNAAFLLWRPGALANVHIKLLAETGSRGSSTSSIGTFTFSNSNVSVGTVRSNLFLSPSVFPAAGTSFMDFDGVCTHPLVTLAGKMRPSPDWFLGITTMSLLDENGDWRNNFVVPLYVYDAGTDSGTEFTSENEATDPPAPIVRIVGNPTFGPQAGQGQVGTVRFDFR